MVRTYLYCIGYAKSISVKEVIESRLNKDQLLIFWRISEFLIFISGASGIFSGMYCVFKKFKLI